LTHQAEPSERKAKILENPVLPASAETGHLLHKILEKIFERGFYLSFNEEIIRQLIVQEMSISHLTGLEEEIIKMIERVMKICFEEGKKTFSFKDIKPSHVVTEMEFLLEESSSQYLKGFIDLMFQHEGCYYLVDWKSNFLGSTKECYLEENLKSCMEENKYFIQAELYGRALKAYLNRLGKGEESYGGIFYVFLRGVEEGSSKGVIHL
jgi:exodeoxyribonuclease V beta subunit